MTLTSVLVITALCFIVCAWLLYLTYTDTKKPLDPETLAFVREKIKEISYTIDDPYKRFAEQLSSEYLRARVGQTERQVRFASELAAPYGPAPIPMILYCQIGRAHV